MHSCLQHTYGTPASSNLSPKFSQPLQRKFVRTNTEAASQKSGFHTHFKTWVSDFEIANGGSLSSELWRELMAEDVAHPYKEYPLSCVPLPAIDSEVETWAFRKKNLENLIHHYTHFNQCEHVLFLCIIMLCCVMWPLVPVLLKSCVHSWCWSNTLIRRVGEVVPGESATILNLASSSILAKT